METKTIPVNAIRYVEMEPPPSRMDARHQVDRWRHAADWWSGRIVAHVSDVAKAAHAVEQVRVWTEKLVVS